MVQGPGIPGPPPNAMGLRVPRPSPNAMGLRVCRPPNPSVSLLILYCRRTNIDIWSGAHHLHPDCTLASEMH